MDNQQKTDETKEPVHPQIKTIAEHLYCFNCKSDLQTEVPEDRQNICPSCGSTNIAIAKE